MQSCFLHNKPIAFVDVLLVVAVVVAKAPYFGLLGGHFFVIGGGCLFKEIIIQYMIDILG